MKTLITIATSIFLFDDFNEENPVNVYWVEDTQWFLTEDSQGTKRYFLVTKPFECIKTRYRDVILKYALGTYTKEDEVSIKDIFMWGRFNEEYPVMIEGVQYYHSYSDFIRSNYLMKKEIVLGNKIQGVYDVERIKSFLQLIGAKVYDVEVIEGNAEFDIKVYRCPKLVRIKELEDKLGLVGDLLSKGSLS